MKKLTYFKEEDLLKFLKWFTKYGEGRGFDYMELFQRCEQDPNFRADAINKLHEVNSERLNRRIENGHIQGTKNKEQIRAIGQQNVESGWLDSIRTPEICAMGGSKNTEKQKEARAIQNREHFAPAGTAAAAEKKKQQYNEYQLQFYNLIQIEGWFMIKEVQHLVDEIKYKANNKIQARSTLNKRSDLFERKSDDRRYFRKIKTA